jgi:hypothetical protein
VALEVLGKQILFLIDMVANCSVLPVFAESLPLRPLLW